jgi:hypothetical protein
VSDVTLPAADAKALAMALRNMNENHYYGPVLTIMGRPVSEWVELLDPRPASLRDECIAALAEAWRGDDDFHEVDAVLAVVRRRVEQVYVGTSVRIYRDSVLSLLEVKP